MVRRTERTIQSGHPSSAALALALAAVLLPHSSPLVDGLTPTMQAWWRDFSRAGSHARAVDAEAGYGLGRAVC